MNHDTKLSELQSFDKKGDLATAHAPPSPVPTPDPIRPAWQKLLRTHAAQDREAAAPRPHRHRRRNRPLLNYMGGKSRIAPALIASFPKHDTFIEVFGGSGIISFQKTPSAIDVFNDFDNEVYNLFKIIRERPDELAALLAASPRCRQLYQELEAQDPKHLNSVQRAFRTLYVASHGFVTGQVRAQYFPACRNSRQRWGILELLQEMYRWSERFSRITVENLDFTDLMEAYDSDQAFFFCDPPYPGLEHYYRTTFKPDDHARLAARLKQLKGKALVTLPDLSSVRALYDRWATLRPLPIRYSVSGRSQSTKELLIFVNYAPSQTSTSDDDEDDLFA